MPEIPPKNALYGILPKNRVIFGGNCKNVVSCQFSVFQGVDGTLMTQMLPIFADY